MSVAAKAARSQVWMENLGDWSWPGTGGTAAEILPPSWVPVFPSRSAPLAAAAPAGPWQPRSLQRRLLTGALASTLAAALATVSIAGPRDVERLLGYGSASAPAPAEFAASASSGQPQPLPTLASLSSDHAGSSIDNASYHSPALGTTGSFYVYLPAGFAATTAHYPVLYLLHGDDQQATAFLQVGLQRELDRLIAQHVVPPLIAVMIQGGPGPNNWRYRYEAYVLEVQELIDRMLPTIPTRSARAIAGDSMGGYGAMNTALDNPYRFAVVESWLGFFNGLEAKLHADGPIISALGLRAFIYGAESDRIADPAENPPFAAALRGAGARAQSAVYPGGHSLETVEEHLAGMLTFVGRALSSPQASPGVHAAPSTRHGKA